MCVCCKPLTNQYRMMQRSVKWNRLQLFDLSALSSVCSLATASVSLRLKSEGATSRSAVVQIGFGRPPKHTHTLFPLAVGVFVKL